MFIRTSLPHKQHSTVRTAIPQTQFHGGSHFGFDVVGKGRVGTGIPVLVWF